MKRLVPGILALALLSGCSYGQAEEEAALALRSRVLSASEISFQAEITADYIDTVEMFTLDCAVDSEGVVAFTVAEPEEIAGITGTVSGTEGALTYEDQVLAFPLMADDRLSPVSAPWIMMKALHSGCIVSYVQEGELLHLTIDDSYADDALTVDIWADDDGVEAAQISWQGRRAVSMEIEDFRFG